ncbi:hypothetical protein O181_003665 [Austropuccinia psidii MF-1]|uniref:Uncharacterized protein n=1 Tax=Austropuccinia psidii MF-1 TaxID=1389203 RepID=A0A9Q3BFF9_9BASI|nr:hypothetical protein [Austropuccinia psidii MF-1]
MVGPGESSTKKQQIVLNSSDEASSCIIKNNISTQSEHNVVTPEATIIIIALWMQMGKFEEKTQKEFEILHENNSRLQEIITLKTKTIHTLQEEYTQLSRASEETNKILNEVLEEQFHCKRDREYLDQDMN